ncbi:MAG TPA: RDD family protein [Verrucomicrobiae bacterium]|nr:RDD family protein [Verrucomicrobiae bacterium]
MAEASWYYSDGNAQRGPISLEELRHIVTLRPDTLVWQEGMTDWVSAGSVPGLITPQTVSPTTTEQLNYFGRNPLETPAYFELAGFWLRFVATLLDWIILGLPITAVNGLLFSPVPVYLPGQPPRLPPINFIFNSCGLPLFWTVTAWLYFSIMESSEYQATFGKMVMGLKVVDLAGRRISFARASGRFFGKTISALIFYIGFMMAGWTRYKQALHDLLANTLVARKGPRWSVAK